MVGPHIAGEDTIACILLDLLQKLIVEIMINKAVVGSSCGDVPKYAGEGVALCRTPGTLGVPWPWFSCFMAIFRQFLVGVLCTWHVHSASSYFQTLHH